MYDSHGTEHIFTEDELIMLCREWQGRLRLEFWSVALRIARAREFELTDSQGECRWTITTALATIKILNPIDFPDSPFKQDMEKTLVHELLHLHFCAFDNTLAGSMEEKLMERSIDHLARALVMLKRETKDVKT